MIIVWTSKGKTPPAYLPNFLASVAANPSLDFLMIKYDKYKVGDCDVPLAPDIRNVREVCLK
jgi:hypothetical protein